jgi:hypothetical protein
MSKAIGYLRGTKASELNIYNPSNNVTSSAALKPIEKPLMMPFLNMFGELAL